MADQNVKATETTTDTTNEEKGKQGRKKVPAADIKAAFAANRVLFGLKAEEGYVLSPLCHEEGGVTLVKNHLVTGESEVVLPKLAGSTFVEVLGVLGRLSTYIQKVPDGRVLVAAPAKE